MPRFSSSNQLQQRYAQVPDERLIAACLTGDADAWDALIGRYAALVYATCRRAGMTQTDADDVFQDVCVILLNHLDGLRDTARLSSWLISTTRREVWRRQKKRGAVLESELGEGAWEMEGAQGLHQQAGQNPEADVLALEEQQLVREALARLQDRCRRLLTLLYGAEEPPSYQEIGEQLSLSVGSIGPIRARCLQQLRKLLQEQDESHGSTK